MRTLRSCAQYVALPEPEMEHATDLDLDRRRLMQGGGMLVVGLSLGGCFTARGPARPAGVANISDHIDM